MNSANDIRLDASADPGRARPGARVLTALLLALTAVFALAQLYSAYCQYSWVRMSLNDYGIYTNFIWNSGHGQPFRYLLDKTYLSTHLSFTLLLLGHLFRLWDSAFLLTLVQWLFGVAGLLLLWRIMARHGLPVVLRAAVACCFIGHPYTQSVLLCEFHGVCTYYLLLPWLYYSLAFRKSFAWMPLLLILGLREEAGLVAVPLLLYFAARDRWKPGYVYAALALLYCLLASSLLFPALSGVELTERRARILTLHSIVASFDLNGLSLRARVLFLLFLPALPWLRRGWGPLLLFPLVGLLILQVSPVHYHHGLERHYPAAVFTLLTLGLICAEARVRGRVGSTPRREQGLALYLLAITVGAHLAAGTLPTGADTRDFYVRPNPLGRQTALAARHVPKEGVLITTAKLTGYTANRKDLITDETLKGRDPLVDAAFFAMKFLTSEEGAPWLQRLHRGEFGVTYFDHYYAVLQRGAATGRNRELLEAAAYANRTLVIRETDSHHGEDRFVRGLGLCRYWHGNGSRAPANLTHGSCVRLNPGRYIARFRLAADAPARAAQGNWGILSLHRPGRSEALAQAEVDPVAASPRAYRLQDLPFEVPERMDVEVRVTAGDAALYLDRVIFLDAPASL